MISVQHFYYLATVPFKFKNTNKVLEQNFKYLEEGKIDKLKTNIDIKSNKAGIIYELPSGIIFNHCLTHQYMFKCQTKYSLIYIML